MAAGLLKDRNEAALLEALAILDLPPRDLRRGAVEDGLRRMVKAYRQAAHMEAVERPVSAWKQDAEAVLRAIAAFRKAIGRVHPKVWWMVSGEEPLSAGAVGPPAQPRLAQRLKEIEASARGILRAPLAARKGGKSPKPLATHLPTPQAQLVNECRDLLKAFGLSTATGKTGKLLLLVCAVGEAATGRQWSTDGVKHEVQRVGRLHSAFEATVKRHLDEEAWPPPDPLAAMGDFEGVLSKVQGAAFLIRSNPVFSKYAARADELYRLAIEAFNCQPQQLGK